MSAINNPSHQPEKAVLRLRVTLDRPLVGGRLGFSVDAIVALRPDLVVVTPSRQAASQLVDPMERLGVPVLVLLGRSVEEILDNIRLVARASGVTERGEAVAKSFADRLARVTSRVAEEAAPTVVMITGRLGSGLMLVAREGTYTGDAIVRAGGRFALKGTAVIAQVSPEAILNADPDILLWAGVERDLEALIFRSRTAAPSRPRNNFTLPSGTCDSRTTHPPLQ